MSLAAEVAWDAPEDGVDVDGFLVERFDEPGGPWVHVTTAPPDARSVIVDGLPQWNNVRFRIRLVVAGNPQPEDAGSIVTLSRNAPTFPVPVAPANFRAAQQGWTIACEWDALDPTDIEFADAVEIREGASWELGVVRAVLQPTERRAVFGYTNTAAQTYRAKVKDILGRYGPESTATVTPYPDEYYPVKDTVNETTWAGTFSNAENDSDDARLALIPVLLSAWTFTVASMTWPLYARYKTQGTYTSAVQDRGAVVTEKIEVSVDASLEGAAVPLKAWRSWRLRRALPGPDDLPFHVNSRPVGAQIGIDAKPLDGLGVGIEIAADPSTNPPTNWQRWIPGSVYRFRYVRLRMTLSDPFGQFTPRVETLSWVLRRRNLKKHGRVEILDTAGDGTTVTFGGDEAFTGTPNVTSTPEVQGATEIFAGSISSTGCKIKLYDLAGTRITGWVQWHAMGE